MTEALFPRPLPVDWFRLLADLDRAGHSNYAVAHATNIPTSTLHNYKTGARIYHDNGEVLVIYYEHTLGKPAPRLAHHIPANLYA